MVPALPQPRGPRREVAQPPRLPRSSQWATHRDARWFPEPGAFRPERWDEKPAAEIPAHAWFPFGAGPRACLGARFALVEAVLVLAAVARRLHLEVDPGDIPPVPGLTLQPGRDVLGTVREAGKPGEG